MGQTKRPSLETTFSKRFHLRLPLVVAPMAGVTTPDMVAHVSNAGAVGSLACAYMTAEEMAQAISKTNLLTSRPYAINLFAPSATPAISDSQLALALTVTEPYRKELGLAAPKKLEPPFQPDFDRQFEVVLKTGPTFFSFVFGTLDRYHLDACRDRGIVTIGAATTLEEGLKLEAAGVHYIVAQGTEAGGHRAIFSAEGSEPGIGALELTKTLVRELKTPVIASGGIMNGKAITEMIQAGAAAVQMGTAFLLVHEASTSKAYRKLLLSKEAPAPELTRAFSGRLARGIPNRFQEDLKAAPHAILPFPAQNAFTKELRQKSAQLESSAYISAWAGTGVKELRSNLSSVSLIHELEREALSSLV